MSFEVDSAYHTECSMKAIRNGYGLWCAVALLVILYGDKKPHHQIEITSRTGLLSTNEWSVVPCHIIKVGRLACLEIVGHYVACFA